MAIASAPALSSYCRLFPLLVLDRHESATSGFHEPKTLPLALTNLSTHHPPLVNLMSLIYKCETTARAQVYPTRAQVRLTKVLG